MKKILVIIMTASLAIMSSHTGAYAKKVSPDEALKVATKWIAVIIEKKGSWGDSDHAEVEEIRDLKRKGKQIGYFCKVSPRGFIVISLRRELAPVKAYSATAALDPESDEGLADLIKGGMERMVNGIERRLGVLDRIPSQALQNILDINYASAWDELIGKQSDASPELTPSDVSVMNYGGGDILLSTTWEQGKPYNNLTPAGSGDEECDHTLVGCVAVATAQVMRFWSWPPYGVDSPYDDPYDWPRMLDVYKSGSYTLAEGDAVAEICYEAGFALNADYGCDGTSAYVYHPTGMDVENVLEDYFRYSDSVEPEDRNDYTAQEWFDIIKGQINYNQPMVYRVEEHAIVCDGWQEIGATRQYHMNYGWGYSSSKPCGDTSDGQVDCNAWYTLDALYLGDYDTELIQQNIRPAQSLSGVLLGTYTPTSFPYRYFNVDAIGFGATFDGGQYLQFLPGIKVTGSGMGVPVRFWGAGTTHSRLFSRGDIHSGILLRDGSMRLYNGGGLKFH